MKQVKPAEYSKLLKEGKIPRTSSVNGRDVYLRSDNKWIYKDSKALSINPFLLRCKFEGCNKLVTSHSKKRLSISFDI